MSDPSTVVRYLKMHLFAITLNKDCTWDPYLNIHTIMYLNEMFIKKKTAEYALYNNETLGQLHF